MLRFSLKELFYWSFLATLLLGGLASIPTPPVLLVIQMIWLIGTLITGKMFNYRVSVAYSLILGFLFFAAITPIEVPFNPSPPGYLLELWLFSLTCGLLSGLIVWSLVFAADKAFERFIASK
jgi:hypothetical protein